MNTAAVTTHPQPPSGGPSNLPVTTPPRKAIHPGGNPEANFKSISHRCHPILVAFVWELTKGGKGLFINSQTRPLHANEGNLSQETIDLPLGCLQGGARCDIRLWLSDSSLSSSLVSPPPKQHEAVVHPRHLVYHRHAGVGEEPGRMQSARWRCPMVGSLGGAGARCCHFGKRAP